MLPICIIIKILSYKPSSPFSQSEKGTQSEKEKRKYNSQFLALRLLNKRIAAAFRPTKMILYDKNIIIPEHIKTIQWKTKKYFERYDIAELVVKNPHITRLISDHNNYCFDSNYEHIKKITCTSAYIFLENCEKSKLTYYKGPYNHNLQTFPFLKKICLTNVYERMRFNDNLKKITVDTYYYKFFDLSDSKIEVLKLKGNGRLGKNSLPGTLKVLKVLKSIYEENKSFFENVNYKLIVF